MQIRFIGLCYQDCVGTFLAAGQPMITNLRKIKKNTIQRSVLSVTSGLNGLILLYETCYFCCCFCGFNTYFGLSSCLAVCFWLSLQAKPDSPQIIDQLVTFHSGVNIKQNVRLIVHRYTFCNTHELKRRINLC